MTQATLFPVSHHKPERWKFPGYAEAGAFAHGLLCSDKFDDILILTPDPEKPDRIVQAVKK